MPLELVVGMISLISLISVGIPEDGLDLVDKLLELAGRLLCLLSKIIRGLQDPASTSLGTIYVYGCGPKPLLGVLDLRTEFHRLRS